MSRGYCRNRKRVAGIMKRQGLRSKVCRKFRVKITDTNHAIPFSPNLLNRQFTVERPNAVWVTDITYLLPSKIGWLYLTLFIDLFSRLVVIALFPAFDSVKRQKGVGSSQGIRLIWQRICRIVFYRGTQLEAAWRTL